jgi:hypothetical protein
MLLTVLLVPFVEQGLLLLKTTSSVGKGTLAGDQFVYNPQSLLVVPTQVYVGI